MVLNLIRRALGLESTPIQSVSGSNSDAFVHRTWTSVEGLALHARDYAPAGGEIAISVDSRGPALVVTVANTVENLNPEDLDRFFDRFWRKEAARTGGRHFGLGLPLARTFASVMGWELTARLDRPGWLVLTLKAPFPRAGVA